MAVLCEQHGVPYDRQSLFRHRVLIVDHEDLIYTKILRAFFETIDMEVQMLRADPGSENFMLGFLSPDVVVANLDIMDRVHFDTMVDRCRDEGVKLLVTAASLTAGQKVLMERRGCIVVKL